MHKLLESYPGIATTYIKVGEGGVYTEPMAVQTLLGSCVSVTFHHPETGTGAVFHALMPQAGINADKDFAPFKFVDTAIDSLLSQLHGLGIKKNRLTTKVFGGANSQESGFVMGRRNVEAAFACLDRHGLRIASTDVGGNRGRKLLFISHTGEIFIKRLTGQAIAADKPA